MPCGPQAARVSALDWFERAAAGASLLCLIHCAGLPLLLAALPALSRLVALPESLHLWLLLFAIPASGSALLFGFRQHRAWLPLAGGAIGLGLLAIGALLLEGARFETPVTIAGSLCLVAAHVGNWRRRHGGHRHG
ncbi:MerC domain-containing protein [Sphingomonas sp. HITSZ_GF]|uniref:MerC domain-containing protein n=1 Tax=Sphingomonas sp. HITSZ_GF TaxID=3037247 RepID=UPI00240D73AC|nr:MerC domain-containing protein [Sphingomonas sp. HITSZ_GF]MDG2534567.1 MerC domain-containing protein [Sphingomonas sp. HITSZ_GF]